MVRRNVLAGVAGAVALVAPSLPAQAQTKIEQAIYRDLKASPLVRVIVVTKPDRNQAGGGQSFSNPASYLFGTLGSSAKNVRPIGSLTAASVEVTADAVARLREDPNVALVTRDIPSPPTLHDSVPAIGADRFHGAGFRGDQLNVAVLDTGVDKTHAALAKAVVGEACFSTAKSDVYKVKSLCPGGFDAFLQDGAAGQCPKDVPACDHGTHVAGIVAGKNMKQGDKSFGGVAPGAGVFAIQVFTLFEDPTACGGEPRCVMSFTSDQKRALDYIFKRREEFKIAAVNMSLGSGYHDQHCDTVSALTAPIEALRAKNIPTVVAAGNEGFFDGIAEPACISSAISVAALGRDSQLDVSYSNVAPLVTFAAPGTNIDSTVFAGAISAKSGTSMAAPHVAAAFALLRQQNPKLTVKQMQERLLQANGTVADPRTGTQVTRIGLASLAQPAVAENTAAGTSAGGRAGGGAGGGDGLGKVAQAPKAAAEAPKADANTPPATRSARSAAPKGPAPTGGNPQFASDKKDVESHSYIVKTDKSAADIKATLDQNCSGMTCNVRQIGNNAYKIDIAAPPAGGASRSATDGSTGTRSPASTTRGAAPRPAAPPPPTVDRQALEQILGKDVKVYDNRLSRPSQ